MEREVLIDWGADGKKSGAEFQIEVVELAMSKGYDINLEIWEQDKPKFFAGDADDEMKEDLQYVADYAIQWMEELEDGFELDVTARGLEKFKLDESQKD